MLTVFGAVSALSTGNLAVTDFKATINGVDVSSGISSIAGNAGDVLPLKVVFSALDDASDAKVKAWISGYRTDIVDSTSRFELLNGSTYAKTLALRLPSDIDPSERFTLFVRIETGTGYHEESFPLMLQRESYNIEILSVEFSRTVSAGNALSIDVVLKNRGFNRLDDTFVKVSIPELGVEKRAYFGDITPLDEDSKDNGKEDAVLGRLNLVVPSNAVSGVYDLVIEASTVDSVTSMTKKLVVSGTEMASEVLTSSAIKDFSKGSEITYDLILVNSGSNVKTYEIIPESASGLLVRANEPVVTVGPMSSKTVSITVRADNSGTYNFGVNVNSNGALVKRVPFTANVTGSIAGSNAVVLTVVLAIVFVVLLVILIVLLTRKPQKSEEFGESYY
ncbi:hypothetical protein COU61_02050 [Candidatus Pacearchaeota archaeon CG10_big_fil_rev_8_21_14_0_10_35_13]|nr:MAG: hypothetical protein COU61_02050 [Candidatus Pacearchaeota archaeon CG10_big_fil_rev_8_21_14_0_10_35_13]